MPNPNELNVTVHLHLDQDPNFSLSVGGRKMGKNEPIVFQNNGRPGFNIHYTLDDPTNTYKWPHQSDKEQAVWSELGETACPNDPVWQVLQPKHISGPNRETLTVYNPNVKPVLGPFRYTLRVVNSGGTWLNLDPGGNNQNGSIGGIYSEYSLALLGAAAGVAISYFLNNALVASSAVVYALSGAVLGFVVGKVLGRREA